jgi:hypothetical protein
LRVIDHAAATPTVIASSSRPGIGKFELSPLDLGGTSKG